MHACAQREPINFAQRQSERVSFNQPKRVAVDLAQHEPERESKRVAIAPDAGADQLANVRAVRVVETASPTRMG